MADVATLRSRLEKIRRARASGISEVWLDDRRARYRSDAELLRAIGALEAELAEAEGTAQPKNLTVIANKGY